MREANSTTPLRLRRLVFARSRLRRAAFVLVFAAAASLVACERGEGGPCEVDSDCEAGLVCDGSPRGTCQVTVDQGDGDGAGDGDSADAATGDGDGGDGDGGDGDGGDGDGADEDAGR